MSGNALKLIEEAANDPDLTIDKAAVAVVRGVLLGIVAEGGAKPSSAGVLIDGMSKLKGVGGGEDLMEVLRAFERGGDADSTVA